jgi:hypothetical protein
MPHRIHDARQWRARAEEAPALAELLANPESKRIMLRIAVSFTALALETIVLAGADCPGT